MTASGASAENKKKTHCKYEHEFTPENTRISRSPSGAPRRNCIKCEDREKAGAKRKREPIPPGPFGL